MWNEAAACANLRLHRPFGWEGCLSSGSDLYLRSRVAEIFVTFMYEEINRFLSHPSNLETFDQFFGTQRVARKGLQLLMPNDRNRFLHDLYLRQLREAVLRGMFALPKCGRISLTTITCSTATNNLLAFGDEGGDVRTDERGEFTVLGCHRREPACLFSREPYTICSQKQLRDHFRGKESHCRNRSLYSPKHL